VGSHFFGRRRGPRRKLRAAREKGGGAWMKEKGINWRGKIVSQEPKKAKVCLCQGHCIAKNVLGFGAAMPSRGKGGVTGRKREVNHLDIRRWRESRQDGSS